MVPYSSTDCTKMQKNISALDFARMRIDLAGNWRQRGITGGCLYSNSANPTTIRRIVAAHTVDWGEVIALFFARTLQDTPRCRLGAAVSEGGGEAGGRKLRFLGGFWFLRVLVSVLLLAVERTPRRCQAVSALLPFAGRLSAISRRVLRRGAVWRRCGGVVFASGSGLGEETRGGTRGSWFWRNRAE
jgi:hypothetical protein